MVTPPRNLTTEQAHTGQYAIKAEQGQEYPVFYASKLGANLNYVPRHLRLSAWVYLSNGLVRASILVVQIKHSGQGPDVWEGLSLDQVVKRYGQWVYVQKTIDLPAGIEPNDDLNFMVWRPETGSTFYLDDISLEAWR